ncbi:hypothetical protein CHU98_g3709 [Xylaria longipes]|nr:hypothetical protein CHU98_g3709 [Xylaria longipes]
MTTYNMCERGQPRRQVQFAYIYLRYLSSLLMYRQFIDDDDDDDDDATTVAVNTCHRVCSQPWYMDEFIDIHTQALPAQLSSPFQNPFLPFSPSPLLFSQPDYNVVIVGTAKTANKSEGFKTRAATSSVCAATSSIVQCDQRTSRPHDARHRPQTPNPVTNPDSRNPIQQPSGYRKWIQAANDDVVVVTA